MSLEANKAIVMQLYEEVFNKGDLDLANKLIAPNAVNHDPQLPPRRSRRPTGAESRRDHAAQRLP
jgi:predicted SnoaL-like aldol condensation-catalyzing enzyme